MSHLSTLFKEFFSALHIFVLSANRTTSDPSAFFGRSFKHFKNKNGPKTNPSLAVLHMTKYSEDHESDLYSRIFPILPKEDNDLWYQMLF